jgi:hypothetical protein
MIAVRMGDKDVGDRFAADGLEQGRDMGGIVRARIDYRDLPAANDVTDRPLKRVRARIVGGNRPHSRHYLLDLIGCEAETLIERDVVIHLTAAP